MHHFATLASTLLLQKINAKEVTIVLQKSMSLILVARWLIVIFIISVVGVAVIPFEKGIQTGRILEDTIINKNIELVTVGANEHPGQILTLNTGPGIDRLALRTGDQIIVEFSPDYTIRWISKRS